MAGGALAALRYIDGTEYSITVCISLARFTAIIPSYYLVSCYIASNIGYLRRSNGRIATYVCSMSVPKVMLDCTM